DGIFFIGRSYGEAPEVDPVIYIAASDEGLMVDQTCLVRLIEAGEYDMTGVTQI
ncbi:MAG TPA: 30S ribosomal protein S12 methylthiotransferase RimO, partial [Clostridiales bacterium]|nr:30S ribosomal protein S12 methylthiotransferase RimO [Clostridiales bacterium]